MGSNGLKSSLFIPYIKTNNGLEIFLQKRTMDAKNMPGLYGIWGGLVEKEESPEDALVREVKEELDIIISDYKKIGIFNFGKSEKHVFVKEVTKDFEDNITVKEGDYGKWFNIDNINKDKDIRKDYKEALSKILNNL